MSFQKYNMLWLLISIITILSIAFSSSSIIINSTTIDETENDNNYTSLCNISVIACLNDILHLQKIGDYKIQIDLILDEVNSTKLKEYIDVLSSFHTRHTKSHYIENVALAQKRT